MTARHHTAVALRTLDCSPSAASSADAPSVVVVDVDNSVVAVFASPDWLGSGAEVVDAREGMGRVVDGTARRVPCWTEERSEASTQRGVG